MSRLTRYMPAVAGYRERLATLQGTWDSLALLSHLSEDGMNLSATRQEFESLAGDLITHLEAETHRKALLAARARAQMAIDVLVRNLFERTADIGFLAADAALRRFTQELTATRTAGADGPANSADSVQRRLAEYVAKYSVYHNVILISPAGEVLLQLDGGGAPPVTRDPLVPATLTSNSPYVETFRTSDLVPEARQALIYSHRVEWDGQTHGVLCLCFRFEDECDGIFSGLLAGADWTVVALLDAANRVIASSDQHQLPVGARVEAGSGEGIIRFSGREFLAVTRIAQPYQGYAGPSWRGLVMVPLDRAFEFEGHGATDESGCSAEVLADLRASSATFSEALRQIPRQADTVQSDLNRSVWNGSIRLSLQRSGSSAFAKALLREISNMGRKTKEIFERSIQELHETVVSAILHDSRFMASLAIEIQARNLYERANDCRWWALDATLIGRLEGAPDCDDGAAAAVLGRINALYTVYHCIVLLDAQRRVVATSRSDQQPIVGTCIDEPWATTAVTLATSQDYCVSEFQPSVLSDGSPVLIYGAAVRSANGRVVGAVGVVFDTTLQLGAMLSEALPRDERGKSVPGCAALFLDSRLRLMCTTDPSVDVDSLDLDWIRKAGDGDSRVMRIGGSYHAVGVKADTGYREYRGIGGYAVTLVSVGEVPKRRARLYRALPARAARGSGGKHDVLEFATVVMGQNWYALPASSVIEAVDARKLQSLPAQESWYAGLLMFDGEPIAVADVRGILGGSRVEDATIAVVVRPAGGGRPYGLLAETLGDIWEVSQDRLLPIGGSAERLTPFAIEPTTSADSLVLVLSPEHLESLVRGEAAAVAAA